MHQSPNTALHDCILHPSQHLWSRHFTGPCKSVHPWERGSEIQSIKDSKIKHRLLACVPGWCSNTCLVSATATTPCRCRHLGWLWLASQGMQKKPRPSKICCRIWNATWAEYTVVYGHDQACFCKATMACASVNIHVYKQSQCQRCVWQGCRVMSRWALSCGHVVTAFWILWLHQSICKHCSPLSFTHWQLCKHIHRCTGSYAR